MTLNKFPGGLFVPLLPSFSTTPPTIDYQTIDASVERVAFIFTAPKSGVLDKVEFRTGSVTLNVASTLKISLQNISFANEPDGIADEYRIISSLSSNSWISPGLFTSDGTDSGTKRTVVRGDIISCVIEFDTFNASDSVQIGSLGVGTASPHFPNETEFYNGTNWSHISSGPIMALLYEDGTYPYTIGAYPYSDLRNVSFNLSSSPDERGIAFSFPSNVRIGGAYARVSNSAGGGANIPYTLYDHDGYTVLVSVSVPVRINERYWSCRFGGDVLIEANQIYRFAVSPASSSFGMTLAEFDTNTAAIMRSLEGGENWYLTSRTDGGTWIDTPTTRPFISILVTAVDQDISGGSAGPGFEGDP